MARPEPQLKADVLEQLCAHFGISTHYQDIRGTSHPVAQDVLFALLGEFDLDLDTAGCTEGLLDAIRRSAWQQALPTVLAIASASEHWSLSLRLPASVQKIQWQLTDEAGVSQRGEVDVHCLHELTHREIESVHWSERTLSFAFPLAAGYHHFSVDGLAGRTLIISAPQHCYRPLVLRDGGRIWGLAVQLYALRSERNWGMGDFSDLVQLIAQAAQCGADLIGLNPLHALFGHDPAHASPYSPSSRLQVNVLYIDVEAVDEYALCDEAKRRVLSSEFQSRLARLRQAPLVDHVAVAAAKFEILELLFSHFQRHHLSPDGAAALDDAGREFLRFVTQGGDALRRHAVFETLQAHFHAADAGVWGWPAWPLSYRDPDSDDVATFAQQHQLRVLYHQYLQWLASIQLARAQAQCKSLGLRIGLYFDLAVSVDRGGSDVWREPADFAVHASIGAPADEFNPNGQGWGLPPLRPDRLRQSHYRFFIETLRSNMRGAGALRIDHVMGLMRLLWIPKGRTARDGTYVHYASNELLAIVALESQRHRCMVIGEDLGTVDQTMRAALARREIHSYRLLYFERDAKGDFKPPGEYPANALVAVGTHDLAPLAGWWASHDLRLRLRFGLFPSAHLFANQLMDRARERVALLRAMERAGLLSAEQVAQAAGSQRLTAPVLAAVHLFLAATRSALMLVQLEDLVGATEQVNVPGTTDEQPNWRRKLPLDMHALAEQGLLQDLGRALAGARPR